jgi:hypothetical protein
MMPTRSIDPDPGSADSDGLDVLRRLAAKGAYAAPSADAPGAYAIFSPVDGVASPSALVSAEAFARARVRGWLETEGPDRYRLSAAGIKGVREARSGGANPHGQSGRSQHGRAQSANRAAEPARTPQERPLAWLRRRRDRDGQPLVTEPQFVAGERLAGDYWHAQLSPRVTADWSGLATSRRTRRAAPGAGVELGDHVVAARQRIARALAAVGPELAGILLDVCCHDVGLEAAGRAQGWPQRAAKVVLQLALTRLARHYGLIAPEPAPTGLRHWGSDDYRPNIDAWR